MGGPIGVGETITVINKSGKVVSSSKHLVSVFKEAKAAYNERKAELKAEKDAAHKLKKLNDGVKAERIDKDNDGVKAARIDKDDDDVRSRASSHRSKHSRVSRTKSHRTTPRERPPLERGQTDSFLPNDPPRNDPPRRSSNPHRFEQDLAGDAYHGQRLELARRNTHHMAPRSRRKPDAYIDMDLAYGDIPPPLPAPKYDDYELKEKASKITMLLDEANCLQYSVTQTIENLQKKPEALAAVSLTLAEISAIVTKLGPGVLLTLKGSFPAVAALLLSPQFMIAGGVAVGVTIVALGGYKIIKKIQAENAERVMAARDIPMRPMAARARVDSATHLDQLDELEPAELSRVEMWRRGIADVEAVSSGTSVDGEFITPDVSRKLVTAGVLDEDDLRSRRSARSRVSRADSERKPKSSHRAKSERSVRTTRSSDSKRSKTVKEGREKSLKDGKEKSLKDGKEKSIKDGKEVLVRRREKEPSGLKMLFRSHSTL